MQQDLGGATSGEVHRGGCEEDAGAAEVAMRGGAGVQGGHGCRDVERHVQDGRAQGPPAGLLEAPLRNRQLHTAMRSM